MDRHERFFALTISGVHGIDHLLKRVFPPLLPVWAVTFGYPLWQLGLLLGVYTFGSAIGQAPIGVLSDRYNRRYLLSAGIGGIGIGLGILAVVPLFDIVDIQLSIARYTVSGQFLVMMMAMFAAGLGSSSVHPTGYPLITANVSDENKETVLSMWGSASKFGDGVAPAVVGVLLLVLSWNSILGVFSLLAIGYALVLFVLLRAFETRPSDRQTTDTKGPTETDQTAVDRRDKRIYLYPMLAVFVYFTIQIMASSGVTVFLPKFITSVYGYSFSAVGVTFSAASTASFYYSAMLIIAGVAQLATGKLASRYDYRWLIIGYLSVAAIALAVLSMVVLSPGTLVLVLIILGASLYGVNPARDALVSDIAPVEREGRTFGYLWTGTLLASSIAAPGIGYLGEIVGLRLTFTVLAAVILLSAIPIVVLLSDRVYLSVDESRETI
jgi:FSR family fosmidomycin resistance protein-like MFS transporter